MMGQKPDMIFDWNPTQRKEANSDINGQEQTKQITCNKNGYGIQINNTFEQFGQLYPTDNDLQ